MNIDSYLIISIVIIAAITFFTRAVPFLIFGNRKLPGIIEYLGAVLPAAIMVILVCYCLRNIDFTVASRCLPEIIACVAVAVVHVLKKNMYVSIIVGTICYMIAIRVL